MGDLKALFIGIAGGLIVIGIQKVYRRYDRASTEQEIETLEQELNHLDLMNKSMLEMQRSAFHYTFVLLTLVAIAGLVSELNDMFAQDVVPFSQYISGACWFVATLAGIEYAKRFYRLRNIESAKKSLESKLEKLRDKSERIGS